MGAGFAGLNQNPAKNRANFSLNPKVTGFLAGIGGVLSAYRPVNLKPVCLLLSLCHAGYAAALGLGEISMHSYLGQPLHATVPLLDATPKVDADCFSLGTGAGSIAPPLRAQLNIEQSGGQTVLHIRTPQPVHDPVAQFVVVSDCEARLQREYVVLLDPPALALPAVGSESPAVAPTASVPIAAPVPHATPRAKRVAAPARQRATSRPQAPARAAPRLVLSGRHGTGRTDDRLFALRLDTNLPDLTQPRPDSLTATELSDENTALTRKLAHLQSQLTALQLRNAELEAKRTVASPAAATAAVTPPSPVQTPQWPLYLLGIGLLSGGGALAAWLHRRSHRRLSSGMPDDMPWPQLDTEAIRAQPAAVSQPTLSPAPEREPEPERMTDFSQPTQTESTEVKDDILDQAEVYVAHGHAVLAIHLLQEHLRDAPTESPVPWMLLLDLLHREGDIEGYAAASAECRRHFNVNFSDHPVSQDSEQGRGLEAYPHLIEQLVTVWNSPELDAFFNELIYDQRGGTRMGFEPAAYRDILLLRAIARDALPLAA